MINYITTACPFFCEDIMFSIAHMGDFMGFSKSSDKKGWFRTRCLVMLNVIVEHPVGGPQDWGSILVEQRQNLVSWQSTFWPLAACTLVMMLQSIDRVCGARYKDSCGLRSSPFVCISDMVNMLVIFTWMLVLGCWFKVAARHVWYDWFETEVVKD